MKNLSNLSLYLAVLLVTCESIPLQEASTQSDTKSSNISPNIQTDLTASLKETPKTKRGLYHGPSFLPAAPLLTAHAPIIAAPAPIIHPAHIAVAAPIFKGASSFSSVRTYHAPLAVPILHAPAITAVHAPILHPAPILHAPTFAAYHAPVYHAPIYHAPLLH